MSDPHANAFSEAVERIFIDFCSNEKFTSIYQNWQPWHFGAHFEARSLRRDWFYAKIVTKIWANISGSTECIKMGIVSLHSRQHSDHAHT